LDWHGRGRTIFPTVSIRHPIHKRDGLLHSWVLLDLRNGTYAGADPLAVGFVGAYTTFSTFEYETFKMLETGSGIAGFMKVILSLLLGFLGLWGGVGTARTVRVRTFVENRATPEREHPDREDLNIPFESLEELKEMKADGN
jgi:hypothetical protein